MKAQPGLPEEAISSLVNGLLLALSDTHILYVKTLNCHWNVDDPKFLMLHELFENQYKSLADQVDALAERVRMLGKKVPASLKLFLERGSLKEIDRELNADGMLQELAESHEKLAASLRKEIKNAENCGDPGTADLLIGIVRFHEKAAWFLRSHL